MIITDIIVISTACHTAINRNIYKEFIKEGITLRIVIPKKLNFKLGSIQSEPPAKDDPPIEYLDLRGNNQRYSSFKGIIKLLNLHKPKLVILDNDPISLTALQVGLWSKFCNSKLFCISCENIPFGLISSFKRRGIKGLLYAIFKKILLRISQKIVHGVFTINNEGTEIFKKEKFINVKKIPLGFDPKYFQINQAQRDAVRSKLNLNGFVIGFFGRITYEKGIHILIDALNKMKDSKWTLLMDEFDIYKNEFQENIKKLIVSSDLLERVVSINPKHIEMAWYINSVDVVVMPSVSTPNWIEQYGRIAAESMACGKLVVASNSGSLPMLLNNRGIIFEENNSNQLAEILNELIDSPNYFKNYNRNEVSDYAFKELSIKKQMIEMISFLKKTNAL